MRLGIRIGVDGFAHLPGYGFEWSDTPASANKFDPTEEDFKALAKKKIILIPTLSLSKVYSYKRKKDGTVSFDKERHQKVVARQKRLLGLMLRTDVRLAFGSDQTGETLGTELQYIHENKLLDNLTILQIATRETPRAIFPDRKIGLLKSGYEASFLVLEDDPIIRFEAVKNIKMRFKQGNFINLEKK